MGGSRKSQILFSCGVALILAQPTWADFVGIVTTTRDDPDTVALCNNAEGDFVPFPLTVCNIFAIFDDPYDRLLGIENADLQVYDGKTPDVFFQHPLNPAVIAPTCFFIDVVAPDLICDTFITIGYECGPAPDGTDKTAPDDDFDADEFNFNGHVVGGWFDGSPTNGGEDCSCYPDLQPLFLQTSVAQGRTVFGTLDILWKAGFNDDIMVEQGVFIECTLVCDADFDGNGAVNASDLAQLLGAWGPCPGCPADLNLDNAVDAADLAMLLGTWGPCS